MVLTFSHEFHESTQMSAGLFVKIRAIGGIYFRLSWLIVSH